MKELSINRIDMISRSLNSSLSDNGRNLVSVVHLLFPPPPCIFFPSNPLVHTPVPARTRNLFHLHTDCLLAFRIQHLGHSARALGHLSALAADEVPGEVEQLVHGLETLSARLGQKEPNPAKTKSRYDAEEEHGPSVSHGKEHERDSL